MFYPSSVICLEIKTGSQGLGTEPHRDGKARSRSLLRRTPQFLGYPFMISCGDAAGSGRAQGNE